MSPTEKAVFAVLLTSVRSGLKATLSANDCEILLSMLTRKRRKQPAPPKKFLDDWVQRTASALVDVFDAFSEDLEEFKDDITAIRQQRKE